MPKQDGDRWISSAGGAVVGLGVLLALSGESEADPGDGNGDDDNGNGTDPEQNDPPTASVDSMNVNSGAGTVDASATGNDPDGSIVAWDWQLIKNSSVVDEATGKNTTMSLDGSGDYTLSITATDDDGEAGMGTYSFPYTAPSPNEPPAVSINSFTTTDGVLDATADASDPDGSIATYSWELRRDGSVVDTAMGNPVSMDLAGSGDYVFEVTVTDDDGAAGTADYSFPYTSPDPGNGDEPPDYQVIEENVGSALTAEVSVFTSESLYGNTSRMAEDVIARFAARAIANTGFNARVQYDMPIQNSATEVSGCHSDGQYDSGALSWWKEHVDAGNVADRHISKDSNILLTNAAGGGCAEANGTRCIAGCGTISNSYPTQDELPLTSGGRWSVMNSIHEIGHNFNQGHASGYAIRNIVVDEYRLPPNYTQGGTTYCGDPSPEPADRDTRILIVSWEQECSKNRFENAIN